MASTSPVRDAFEASGITQQSAGSASNDIAYSYSQFEQFQNEDKEYYSKKHYRKRLLVVDDDDVDRERISRYIKRYKLPLSIVGVGSGRDALTHVQENDIDLIVLDYQLGDMTGIELLAKIRVRGREPIPTIMITGLGDEATATEALRLGVFDYLPKRHLTADALVSTLKDALRATEMQRELAENQKRLKYMSLYDSLTGLPNRNLFFDRLNQAINMSNRENSSFAVVMIDLNLFKEINDSMGHQAGDSALKIVADRLATLMRKSDTVARLGGDEFVCILHNIRVVENALNCSEKILDAIEKPFVIDERLMRIGAALGIARYPEHGRDASSLLSNADKAMYKAKKSSRNYVVYNEVDDNATSDVVPLSQFLINALKTEDEIYLEYQPKVNLISGELVGLEALVRWENPRLGMVPPDTFVQVAERSTLILELTHKIVTLALTQFSAWRRQGFLVPMSINISARSLDDANFPDWMDEQVSLYGLSPGDLYLEITETTLAASGNSAQRVLDQLAQRGYKISIDDFGKGYTSFQFIRDILIHEIKIDKIFIKNITTEERDIAIVRSLILLADSMGLGTVAEGVETRQQLEKLRDLGCPNAQGFHIARPMNAKKLLAWYNRSFNG